jgi:Flp pilus assembly protein TadG
MKIKKNLFKDKKGQSVIEFALVLPILLLVLLGIFEFGRIIMAVNVVNQAAREGARVGAVTENATDTTSFYGTIRDRVQVFMDAANLKGTSSVIITPPGADKAITVTINYDFPFATKFFDTFLPHIIKLKGSCVMYYEG